MDKSTAKALIDQQRRRWRSQGPDVIVARRAERAYLICAGVFAGAAPAFLALYQHPGLFPRIVEPAGFLIGAAILFWQSRRFTQIRRLLSTPGAKTDFL